MLNVKSEGSLTVERLEQRYFKTKLLKYFHTFIATPPFYSTMFTASVLAVERPCGVSFDTIFFSNVSVNVVLTNPHKILPTPLICLSSCDGNGWMIL